MDKGVTPLRLPIAFEEKALGLIWNRKPGGDILFEKLGERLNEKFHFKRNSEGACKHSLFLPSFGLTTSITKEIKVKD